MTDRITPARRSLNMRAIGPKNTEPELAVRRLLHARGYRYRLHRRGLPGKPDIVFAGRQKIILVHGCFWHRHPGCALAANPGTREDFWQAKFEANVARDARNLAALESSGWKVLVIWECEIRDPRLAERLLAFLGPQRSLRAEAAG